MKVSIIVPIYNVEQYIEECLNSIYNQELADFEVLCIDDKGNDKSIEKVRKFVSINNITNLKIIEHNKNKGLSEARNTGIKNAKGKYICFLDSDDMLIKGGLKQLIEQAEKNDLDIIEGRIEEKYETKFKIELDEKYDTSNITLDIDDFTYEVIDEEKMRLNITLCIDNIEEKEVVLPVEDVIEDFDTLELEDKNSGNRESKNDGVLDDLFLDTSKKVPLEFDSKKEIVEEESEQNNNDNTTTINNAESVETSNELIYENNTSNNNTNNDTNKPPMVNNNVSSIFSSFKDNIETYKTYSVYIMKEEDTIDVVLQKYGVTREELEEYNDMSDIKTGSKIIVPSSSKNE